MSDQPSEAQSGGPNANVGPNFGPPKSLRGTENADIIWKMITKRFPNAAPLLCEMEAVIDRADELLRQLRPPCNRTIATEREESTANFADSEESDEAVSLGHGESYREISGEYANNVNTNSAEVQVSESSVGSTDTDLESASSNQTPAIRAKFIQTSSSSDKSAFMQNRETSDSHCGTQSRDLSTSNIDTHTSLGDSSISPPSIQESHNKIVQDIDAKKDVKLNNQGGGDDTVSKTKTPWEMLVEYAEECGAEIKCSSERSKPNRVVVTTKLLGFSATTFGDTEEQCKMGTAKKILLNIADHQMNEKKMKQLLHLSNERLLEIIKMDTTDRGEEMPLRKLYLLCLKKGMPPPEYVTDKEYEHQGVKCVAKCMALNYIVEGNGISRYSAKKAAAENLYQKYLSENPETEKPT